MHDQPAPTPNDRPAVWPLVMADMEARDQLGRQRYKVPLQPFNGRDQLADAYAECLDMAVYLKAAMIERDTPADQAVRAERDRCAKVARKEAEECWKWATGADPSTGGVAVACMATARRILEAITTE